MFGIFSEAKNLYMKGKEVLGSYGTGFLGHILI